MTLDPSPGDLVPDTGADAELIVLDPRTGQAERSLRPPTGAELVALAARLREGQPAWEALGPNRRATALLTWRDRIAANRSALERALIADTGRRPESVLEVDAVLGMLTRWATAAPGMLAPPPESPASIPGLTIGGGVHPYSLVGVISPWNFPLLLGLIDAIPALAAGSAVLAKPSEVTPRFVEPLLATLDGMDDLASVLGVVEGGAAVGAAMIPLIDLVVFTGSVPTGRLVGAAAMKAFIPSFLELGGKDAALVFDGADLDRASSALLWGSTANTGQSCLSIERIYVQRTIFDEFVDLLTVKADKLGLAYPTEDDQGIGPLIDPAQATVIAAQLAEAVARGARVHCGGQIEHHGGGTWCPPTVLTGVDHTMTVMTAETFGPIMPVMPFDDADDAVALANDSSYGLSASVFAADADSALTVARRLRAGAVSINDAALTALVYDGEKDSFGASGLGGSRMGPASLRRFLRRQAYLINRSADPDPWW